jgi:hypothetical protein
VVKEVARFVVASYNGSYGGHRIQLHPRNRHGRILTNTEHPSSDQPVDTLWTTCVQLPAIKHLYARSPRPPADALSTTSAHDPPPFPGFHEQL